MQTGGAWDPTTDLIMDNLLYFLSHSAAFYTESWRVCLKAATVYKRTF